jgi:CheY-like chemotaxis protein
VDVALLDVDMPGMNGLETARLAALRGVPVIFLTAHEQHAVEAFQHGAVHYLLKPVDAPALEQAPRAPARPACSPAQVTQPDTKLPDRVALTVRGDVVLVPPASITHALYDGELVTVFTAARSYITDESLQDLEGAHHGAVADAGASPRALEPQPRGAPARAAHRGLHGRAERRRRGARVAPGGPRPSQALGRLSHLRPR